MTQQTTALLVLQTAIIVALLVERTRRRRFAEPTRASDTPIGLLAEPPAVSVERYTAATAAGGVGVWEWNFEANKVYVDPTLESILGFNPGEMTGRPEDWASRVHPQDLPMVSARIKECIERGIADYEAEHRMLHKDGSTRWFLSRGTLTLCPDRTPSRMVGTKVDITELKRAEELIHENQAMLHATNQELQSLAGRLIASQESERGRIARDLHDDVSQQVAGLSIALSVLKRRLAARPGGAELEGEIADLQQRTIALAQDIRHVSQELHPSVLQHVGLVAAMAAHCADLQHRESLTVGFTADGDFTETTGDAALCLYRVAQEALRNVVAHAGGRRADVSLRRNGDLAELTITDDGRGFDIKDAQVGSKGLGLVSITERARLAGGSATIVTELKKGTRVQVQIPASSGESRAVAAVVPGIALTSPSSLPA